MAITPTIPARLARSVQVAANHEEARTRVIRAYRQWYRSAPEICALYALNVSPSAVRLKIRQDFERNRKIDDLNIINVLLHKNQQEYQETMNCWKQEVSVDETEGPKEPRASQYGRRGFKGAEGELLGPQTPREARRSPFLRGSRLRRSKELRAFESREGSELGVGITSRRRQRPGRKQSNSKQARLERRENRPAPTWPSDIDKLRRGSGHTYLCDARSIALRRLARPNWGRHGRKFFRLRNNLPENKCQRGPDNRCCLPLSSYRGHRLHLGNERLSLDRAIAASIGSSLTCPLNLDRRPPSDIDCSRCQLCSCPSYAAPAPCFLSTGTLPPSSQRLD